MIALSISKTPGLERTIVFNVLDEKKKNNLRGKGQTNHDNK